MVTWAHSARLNCTKGFPVRRLLHKEVNICLVMFQLILMNLFLSLSLSPTGWFSRVWWSLWIESITLVYGRSPVYPAVDVIWHQTLPVMTVRSPKPNLNQLRSCQNVSPPFSFKEKKGAPICSGCRFNGDASDSKKKKSSRGERRSKAPTVAACWCVRSVNTCVWMLHHPGHSEPNSVCAFTVELQGWG